MNKELDGVCNKKWEKSWPAQRRVEESVNELAFVLQPAKYL